MTGCTTEAGVPAKHFDTQRIPNLQPLVDEFWCDQVATKSTKNRISVAIRAQLKGPSASSGDDFSGVDAAAVFPDRV